MVAYAESVSTAASATATVSAVQTFSETITTGAIATVATGNRRIPTFQHRDGGTYQIELIEDKKSGELRDTAQGMQIVRHFKAYGTYRPIDVQDLGPQRGDTHEDDSRFIVSDRQIRPIAWGPVKENEAVAIDITYTAAMAGDEVIEDPSENQGGGGSGGGDAAKSQVSLQIGGESIRIENAIAQTSYGGTDFGTIIGQTEQGVEGVDVTAPIVTLTETHYFGPRGFTSEYLDTINELNQSVNNAAFRGFEAGEVLFRGVNAEPAGAKWRLTYNFAIRRNESVTIRVNKSNGDIEDITANKKGWHYLWVKTERTLQTDFAENEAEIIETTGFAIAQVYPENDFSRLAIGTAPFVAQGGLSGSSTISQGLGFPL